MQSDRHAGATRIAQRVDGESQSLGGQSQILSHVVEDALVGLVRD